MERFSSRSTPNSRRMPRTKISTAVSTGPKTATITATMRARNSEARSGKLIAIVLGRTSAKTRMITVIITVA